MAEIEQLTVMIHNHLNAITAVSIPGIVHKFSNIFDRSLCTVIHNLLGVNKVLEPDESWRVHPVLRRELHPVSLNIQSLKYQP